MAFDDGLNFPKELTPALAELATVTKMSRSKRYMVEILPDGTANAYVRGPRDASDVTAASKTGFSQIKLNESFSAQSAPVEPLIVTGVDAFTAEFLTSGGKLVVTEL